jgi:hypothetical protein
MAANNPSAYPGQPPVIAQAGPLNVISNFDLYAPLWSRQLMQPFGGQGVEFLNMFKQMGAMVSVGRSTGTHWEQDRFMAPFAHSGASVTSASPGANITITLSANDVDPATGQSFPIVNEIYTHMPTDKRFQVITKTVGASPTFTTTLVLRPIKNTTSITVASGDYFAIPSNSVGERSGAQATQYSSQTEYTWQLQNIRTDHTISGNALPEQFQVEYMQDGRRLNGVSTLATLQDEYRHLLNIVVAMIEGQTATNTGLNGVGFTTGMKEQFRARAVNVDTGGTVTLTDFEDMANALSANWTHDNMLVLGSQKFYGEVSNFVIGDFDQSNINAVNNQLANSLFGASGFDVNQLYATYSVKGLGVLGRNFGIKNATLFNDPQTFNASPTGSAAQQDFAYVMPIGKAMDAEGLPRNFVEIKYMDNYGYNRFIRVWETGGASAARNTAIDESNRHMISQVGFDFFNLQQCGLFYNGALS